MRETDEAKQGQPTLPVDEQATQIEAFNQIQAELSSLARRLVRATDPDQTGAGDGLDRALLERRDELLQAMPAIERRDVSALGLQNQILQIPNPFATPWRVHPVEGFHDRSNQVPEEEHKTSGFIESWSSTAGEVAWGGSFRDLGSSEPAREKSWHRTWIGSSFFPPAPFKGWLHYRFRLWTEGHIYYAPVDSGAIQEYVAVAGSRLGLQGLPIAPWAYTTTWALDLALPFQPNVGPGYAFAIKKPVVGSIPVEEGEGTAISLILGTMISFANGGTDIAGANMTPTPFGDLARGRVEYRFIPNWWVTGVTEHFATRA